MHAKTSKEIIHATRYMQEKPVVAVDFDFLLRFHVIPFPSFSKSKVCHTPPRVLQETLSVQEYEKEILERELQTKTDKKSNTNKKLPTDPHKPFY